LVAAETPFDDIDVVSSEEGADLADDAALVEEDEDVGFGFEAAAIEFTVTGITFCEIIPNIDIDVEDNL
jgi:hypothetical protein